MTYSDRMEQLLKAADERILILDGAMGTALQGLKFEEADYRGERFVDHTHDLKGNQDVLNLTQPGAIEGVHETYLAAGADIVETNTFNSTAVSQAEYGLEGLARELNREGARLARKAADFWSTTTPDKPRYVAGAMGPTNKTLSVSPDINNPAYRAVTYEQMEDAYREAAQGLIEGGADFLLIETIFDTLNAKAAVAAVRSLAPEYGELPIVLSLTVTDLSGRTLSGQTVEAFWNSVRHAKPLAVGLNCAFGAADLRPYIRELSRMADTRIIAYPNAGLPNEIGEYTETPDVTAAELGEWAKSGFLNIVGGCCGTTPDHIRAIALAVHQRPPRTVPEATPTLRLSGLEALTVPV